MYSDEAILCTIMLKVIYHLPLRALEGFLISLMGLLGILLPVPSYTQICRRAASLGQTVKRLSSKKNVTDIVIDHGLKVRIMEYVNMEKAATNMEKNPFGYL